MCRWMAYSGDSVLIEELLFRPEQSIIDQSLHARLGAYTTNGDGFVIGWYGNSRRPTLFKSTHPAWNNRDLREVAGQIRTPLLYTNSLLKLGSRNGALRWHYQAVPNDFYDWDLHLSPMWIPGKRPMIVTGGKMGYVYAIDPSSGKPIWKVPVGDHNGARLASGAPCVS